jgi:AbiV family abortive infection protein
MHDDDSNDVPRELSAESRQWIQEAREHAEDLIAAAKLLEAGHHNLAFHFAALALEEVGRASLIAMTEIAEHRREGQALKRRADDHEAKLFWALWGPSFGSERLTGEQFEGFQDLAKTINRTRQQGLYYEPGSGSPRQAVEARMTSNIIDLAESRLELAKVSGWRRLEDDQAAELAWFIKASESPELRGLIFGGPSMKKLAESGAVWDWVRWLKAEFDQADEEAREQMRRELSRPKPTAEDADEPKWRLKFRLHSDSHSIRPMPLRYWNRINDWIELRPVSGQSNALDVELTLTSAISVMAVGTTGLNLANAFLAGLNIASRGLFWWEAPRFRSQPFRAIEDLETGSKLAAEPGPALQIEWGRQVLDEETLRGVALCFGSVARSTSGPWQVPIDHYLRGLALMSRSDTLMPLYPNSFAELYQALRSAASNRGDWDGEGKSSESFAELLPRLVSTPNNWSQVFDPMRRVENGEPPLEVSLTTIGLMKVIIDSYLTEGFRKEFEEANGGG